MVLISGGALHVLSDFTARKNKLEILNRRKPKEAASFFRKLIKTPFWSVGELNKNTALNDIKDILGEAISPELQCDSFYETWTNDMAEVTKLFCAIEKSNVIQFWVGTNRGCSRYHIDNVPRRLLVTYQGKGTEWLPDEAADRRAYTKGEPNEAIVKNLSSRKYIDEWDVAVFRGGTGGLLHRTPDEALNSPSVLMRLDNKNYGFD